MRCAAGVLFCKVWHPRASHRCALTGRAEASPAQEVNVGLAADIGSLQRFPKVTGNDSLARELALTGRIFGADEACAAGFVSRVIHGGREEVEKEALDVARTIAGKSPVAVLGTKVLMNRGWRSWRGGTGVQLIRMGFYEYRLKGSLVSYDPRFAPLTRLTSRRRSIKDGLEYTAAWNMAMLQAEVSPLSTRMSVG